MTSPRRVDLSEVESRLRGSTAGAARRDSESQRGGTRPLPTVADRVAQTVVKMVLEPEVEPKCHPDSYGYRPNKSALDAVGSARQQCWRADWVIDLDIKAFFDSLDHELVLRAVAHHGQPVGPSVHRSVASRPRADGERHAG